MSKKDYNLDCLDWTGKGENKLIVCLIDSSKKFYVWRGWVSTMVNPNLDKRHLL